jgi:hypothetical protein
MSRAIRDEPTQVELASTPLSKLMLVILLSVVGFAVLVVAGYFLGRKLPRWFRGYEEIPTSIDV